MKNLLLSACIILFIFKSINAQVPTAMSPDANTFYNNSMPLLRPQVKEIVLKNAKSIKHCKANADSISQALQSNAALKGMSKNDIEGITVLIMVQASIDADADLKQMVMGISHKQKQEDRSAMQPLNTVENKNSPAEEKEEMQHLKLQMIMDRKSMMAEEISYVMKKISGTQQNIINNLK